MYHIVPMFTQSVTPKSMQLPSQCFDISSVEKVLFKQYIKVISILTNSNVIHLHLHLCIFAI